MTDDEAWERMSQLRWKWCYGPAFDTEAAAKEFYRTDYRTAHRAGHYVEIGLANDKWHLFEYVFHNPPLDPRLVLR
jgi:hypothetical protein